MVEMDKIIEDYLTGGLAPELIEQYLTERIMISDYYDYRKAVAKAYFARPIVESQYVGSWRLLISHIEKNVQTNSITSRYLY